VVTVVPTPPLLHIASSPPNAILSWTTNSSFYRLQQTGSLQHPISWAPVTNTIIVAGSNNTVTVAATNAARFYELAAP
jgi:hypothetical protein